MNAPIIELHTGEILRARIRELHGELATVTERYRAAKKDVRSDALADLLRRKSALVQRLFDAQSQLLAVLRAESPKSEAETLAEAS